MARYRVEFEADEKVLKVEVFAFLSARGIRPLVTAVTAVQEVGQNPLRKYKVVRVCEAGEESVDYIEAVSIEAAVELLRSRYSQTLLFLDMLPGDYYYVVDQHTKERATVYKKPEEGVAYGPGS